VADLRHPENDPGVRVKDVAKRFGVSVATLYKRVGVVTPEK
jgi:transposase